jgi:hypothetical protein
VFSAEDDQGATDAGGELQHHPVPGAEGWALLPLQRDDATREHHITLERNDGERVEMTLPSFIERGDELHEIALIVIRARERWRDLKGLGA